jgi:hypothetical protein
MVYTLRFFFSKVSFFHNSNVFGSCIIHILHTGVLKLKENNLNMVYTLRFFFSKLSFFIILTCLVPVLFIFYIQGVLKLKENNSGAKRLTNAMGPPHPPPRYNLDVMGKKQFLPLPGVEACLVSCVVHSLVTILPATSRTVLFTSWITDLQELPWLIRHRPLYVCCSRKVVTPVRQAPVRLSSSCTEYLNWQYGCRVLHSSSLKTAESVSQTVVVVANTERCVDREMIRGFGC